jgi:hypothetical protein
MRENWVPHEVAQQWLSLCNQTLELVRQKMPAQVRTLRLHCNAVVRSVLHECTRRMRA